MQTLPLAGKSRKSDWLGPLILLVPFAVVVVLFGWMREPFPTFHDTDELNYHFPTIVGFYHQLPFPDVRDYRSATGPLFHILFALAAKVIGLNLQSLRLLNVSVSIGAVWVFYDIMRRYAQSTAKALTFSLIFGLSPYFFGASFCLLTDNLGILFCLLAMRSLTLYWSRRGEDIRSWFHFCFWTCAALLTRQTYVWLVAGPLLIVLADRPPWRKATLLAGTLLLASLPMLGLLWLWGGLTPPMFQHLHVEKSLINAREFFFGLALIGFYWAWICPDRVLQAFRAPTATDRYYLIFVWVASWAVLLGYPMDASHFDGGVLWRCAQLLPKLHQTALVFWIFVPLGVLYFVDVLRHGTPYALRWMVFLAVFFVSLMTNTRIYEKYFDPFVILFIMLISFEQTTRSHIARVFRPLLLLGFILYPIVSYHYFRPAVSAPPHSVATLPSDQHSPFGSF